MARAVVLLLALLSWGAHAATVQGTLCSNSRVHTAGYCPAFLLSPNYTSVTATGVSCRATSDQGRGTQSVCVTSTSTPLTPAQVAACSGGTAVAGDSAAVSVSGVQTVGVTGLSNSTTYYCQSANLSPEGWYSNVVVSGQFTTGSTGGVATNAERISAILAGRSPHFSYSTPDDPVITDTTTCNNVTSASQFNSCASVSGRRITINSSFSGNVTINADDIDVVMSNSATINGRVTIGNNTSYIERIRWTGGNVGELNGIRFRDLLFDDVHAIASPATASTVASPEHNFSRGWDGSANPPFQRLAFINTTLELQGNPDAPTNQWAWAFHSGQLAEHSDLIFANVLFLSNHQTNRIQRVRRVVMVDTVMNPNGAAGNGMRLEQQNVDVWIRDSWGNGLFTMASGSTIPGATNVLFDNYDRYMTFNQYVNQTTAANTGTVQNSTLYSTAGAGSFPSISPLTDGGGNQMLAWDGVTVPDYSTVGAVR